MKKNIVITLLLFISASLQAQNSYKVDDPLIYYFGRVTADKTFGWGSSGFQVNFKGSEVEFEMSNKKGPAYLSILINGQAQPWIKVNNGKHTYKIKAHKPQKSNTLRVIKSTEAHTGELQLHSISITDGELQETEKPSKRILFIGDSITCGYGNLGKSVDDGYSIDTEDILQTYGFIASQKINYEFTSVAWSGRGMVRNNSPKNEPKKRYKNTIPLIFDRAIPHNPKLIWDHKINPPNIICINLGTNDNAHGGLNKDEYIQAYKKFVTRLRTYYPNATVIGLVGPMYSSKLYPIMTDWVGESLKDFPNTAVIQLVKSSGMKDMGGHWHPNHKFHKRIGDALGIELQNFVR
ncbi:MAG: GDSL-type esterase/lipase family protein [Lentisphaeraceae bacterium]|nr:GDSL-type esterase/lipase family protein [Lentisphaeraceae bacterium]